MAIYRIFREEYPVELKIALLLSLLFVLIFAMPIHEYAHARTAYALGDKTAYYSGRMTINPLAYFDPFGFMMMVLFGFGWGKGLPVNPNNFKNKKSGTALFALAGPLSNILLAFVSSFLSIATWKVATVINSDNVIFSLLYYLFYCFSLSNISLAIYNLIPIPPLDGSKILYSILPDKYYYKMLSFDRYSFYLLLFIVLVFTYTDISLAGVVEPIFSLFQSFWQKIFF